MFQIKFSSPRLALFIINVMYVGFDMNYIYMSECLEFLKFIGTKTGF